MKTTIKIFVIALTTLAFSGVSFAQAKQAEPTAPAMEKKIEKMADKTENGTKAKSKTKSKSKSKRAAKKASEKTVDKMKTEEKKGDMMDKKSK